MTINTPGDQYEQEADAAANNIVQQQPATRLTPVTQQQASMPVSDALRNNIASTKGTGSKLDDNTELFMSRSFGVDLGNVKVHTDSAAAQMSRSINARAFTTGNDIYFNQGEYNPHSSQGKQVLAHELAHVVQQSTGAHQSIQRIVPGDVTMEMLGRKMQLLTTQLADDGVTTVPAGTTVSITSWSNASRTVTATADIGVPPKTVTMRIDKQHLKPIGTPGSGLRQYEEGVTSMQSDIATADTAIAAHKAKEPEFIKFKNTAGYTKELTRLEGLQDTRYDSLNTRLIQETMVNRFDPEIVRWVTHYNTTFSPATPLNPEIVKSIIYQETKMGTQGVHLEKPPYGWTGATSFPIKSRFNLGQTIDSWGPQQYLMIKEMAPHIYSKYSLGDLEVEQKWKGMSNQDYADWNGGDFVLAMQEYNAFRTLAGTNLNASSSEDLMLDYSYWIRVAVRWLFEKYMSMDKPSWSEAVRAFNGSGPKAERYRKDVMGRVP